MFDDAPDAAAFAIAAGVVEGDFVVADDAVVEVGDVERAVRGDAEVDGAEPWVCAGEEVGFLVGGGGAAVEGDAVGIDAGGDDVSDEDAVVPWVAPDVFFEVGDAADAGGGVGVVDHDGAEADAVVGFSEARIDGSGEELIDGGAVAIRAVEISVAVPC